MTTFTNQTKNSSSFTNQSKSTGQTYFEFLIDATYSFLIENPYTFLIGDSQSGAGTIWTNNTKN